MSAVIFHINVPKIMGEHADNCPGCAQGIELLKQKGENETQLLTQFVAFRWLQCHSENIAAINIEFLKQSTFELMTTITQLKEKVGNNIIVFCLALSEHIVIGSTDTIQEILAKTQ